MNEIDKTLTELLAMLRTTETNMNKADPAPIMMVNEGNAKGKVKWKGKKKIGSKSANPKPAFKKVLKPIGGVAKGDAKGDCHYCKKSGHWKRNCHAYLEDLKKKKSGKIYYSGIYVIEVNLSTSTSWVLDTGCGSRIYRIVQELQMSRTLTKGEVDLRVGNGAKVVALAVGTYHLSLPTGLILELENCFYVLAICRNIISISC
ncbi:CCHC-type domain-containing protein [Heracleum sosnowskyi]|uniref:CCHC-type domain-containing protein n=1 Tax=Heracleum sosnowskyi TaxID=360622 RepID=A0AAD8M6R2_9APIA|nr:CCHC-type domain-containing protein [Heracleum sosnowskyi]